MGYSVDLLTLLCNSFFVKQKRTTRSDLNCWIATFLRGNDVKLWIISLDL